MDLKFEVTGRVNKPVSEVFEAVVNPDQLSAYFTTGGAKGRIETGATVSWDFHDFPGAFPVQVIEVEKDKRIVLKWAGGQEKDGEHLKPYDTLVIMRFEPVDGDRTLISISEEGWKQTQLGLNCAYGNNSGWMQMVCALKAWLEHGINLRDGMFK